MVNCQARTTGEPCRNKGTRERVRLETGDPLVVCWRHDALGYGYGTPEQKAENDRKKGLDGV